MIARLNGTALEVNSGTEWVEVPGTAPGTIVLEVDRGVGVALYLESESNRVTLEIESGETTKTVSGLTIVGTGPTANPNTVAISVADMRWQLPYVFFSRTYNVRRRTPHKRRSNDPGGLPPDATTQGTVVSDDVSFAAWSIKNRTDAWTAFEVATDLLDEVVGAGRWSDRDGVLQASVVPVEEWDFNCQGDTAVGRLLSFMGSVANCYANDEGKLIFYGTQNLGERESLGLQSFDQDFGQQNSTLATLGLRPLTGDPLFNQQDRRVERPVSVRILFERQIEARIDYKESNPLGGGSRAVGTEPLRCQNMIPMPEDGTIGTRQLVQGTWITLDEFIAYCNANQEGNVLAASVPFTRETIRKNWLGNGLNSYGAPQVDRGGVWRKRIGLLREHYRRTFKISKAWLDRIKLIQAYRVSVEDTETNARAPALAYQDYCVVHAWDPFTPVEGVEKELYSLTQNRFSNKSSTKDDAGPIVGTALTGLTPAPAAVDVIDQDLGIIQVTLQADFKGLVDTYERSAAVARTGGFAQFNQRKIFLADTWLTPDHELSLLLTLVLGAPNDKRRLHAVDVTLAEAEALLPSGVPKSEFGRGPVLELRVGLQRAVARFGWDDSKADQFFQSFSTTENFVGPDLGDPMNQAELEDIATAFALREYMRYRDHPEGALTTTFRPSATIGGTVTKITHSLTKDKGATTTVELAGSPPAVDALGLLPPDVRRVVEGYVQP